MSDVEAPPEEPLALPGDGLREGIVDLLRSALGEALVDSHLRPNDDLWVRPAIPVDGVLRPGEAPGHGIAFKPDGRRDHRVGGNEVTAR